MNHLALGYGCFGEPESVLQLETISPGLFNPDQLRVQMLFSPVNASDLIPITGAYRHRTPLPAIAGYEGVGVVIDGPPHLMGKRVLPLRGQGTWQQVVDCPGDLAIPVPDDIDSMLAARAWINPLAAQLMLKLYPPQGKRVLLTAAGSDCAILLGQWALNAGAEAVYGIHRSQVHADRLAALGITPISQHNAAVIRALAKDTDLVYDATGGDVAEQILDMLPKAGTFVCYGLLSGQMFRQQKQVRWFHIRNTLDAMSVDEWQGQFREIWPKLQTSHYGDASLFALSAWREALACYREAGRTAKPMFAFTAG
ncbi:MULTISPECIES: zinc-dependent alcohol dehydrogenase family protein [Lelliottia]|uniref:Alcohol dehydrogenase n=1 Tax=Lelliottia aquatilis TaxID=2080838 RepID=A0ABX5A992_9ENTR|nr:MULTISPECIES: zinc-dependent alcohol dehydrogenase family protein [Lelliottia]NTZ44867.1 zinc-dependent alcohol dehydrogenase family protein [Lelliottia aquatilis]POZ28705.1 alcohol dehydrogenase [Lelliottia aquatilis]POZ33644.1 alcohol dehydrogenase [Lelliottia aquatilis]POZ34178.1 alcohol dehydrogenase [Lelliottia sp. 7254-16]POZ34712.1 alcohol dehydrogenase [Lelliottia aquatilis]